MISLKHFYIIEDVKRIVPIVEHPLTGHAPSILILDQEY